MDFTDRTPLLSNPRFVNADGGYNNLLGIGQSSKACGLRSSKKNTKVQSDISDGKPLYEKARNYWNKVSPLEYRAIKAKNTALESPNIPNQSKSLAIKNADQAINQIWFAKEAWRKVQGAWNNLQKSTNNKQSCINYNGLRNIVADMKDEYNYIRRQVEDAEGYAKKEVGGRLWDKIKKILPVTAGIRNLILVVIRFNVMGLAAKTADLRTQNTEKKKEGWNKLSYTWKNLGGSIDSFNKAIDAGKNIAARKAGRGMSGFDGYSQDGTTDPKSVSVMPAEIPVRTLEASAIAIGAASIPASGGATTPFVAGAVPVLITVLEIMLEAGVFSKQEVEAAANEASNKDLDEFGSSEIFTPINIGLGLLVVTGIGLIVWSFWPKKGKK